MPTHRPAPVPVGRGSFGDRAAERPLNPRGPFPEAGHAYVIGADAGVQRCGDDGEPGGTAGVPVLQMPPRREVCYAVAVVTRYFGGTKLGAGGLIRAYGGAVGAARRPRWAPWPAAGCASR